MADPAFITIPLRPPHGEAMASTRLCQCIYFETCDDFANTFAASSDGAEYDAMWSAAKVLRAALAEAGFAAR